MISAINPYSSMNRLIVPVQNTLVSKKTSVNSSDYRPASENKLISPKHAIANKTTLSNPIALNAQKAYSDTINCKPVGRKLNIDCTDRPFITEKGRRIDYCA